MTEDFCNVSRGGLFEQACNIYMLATAAKLGGCPTAPLGCLTQDLCMERSAASYFINYFFLGDFVKDKYQTCFFQNDEPAIQK